MFKKPKTSHSRRCVAMTPKLASYLREHKAEREWLYRELGKPLTLDDLVFTSVKGKPIDPGVVSHTFASLMLLRGAKPKVISKALGHASVAFTMDCHSHIIEGMQEDDKALLDEVLPAGVNGVSQKNNAKLTPTFGVMSSKP